MRKVKDRNESMKKSFKTKNTQQDSHLVLNCIQSSAFIVKINSWGKFHYYNKKEYKKGKKYKDILYKIYNPCYADLWKDILNGFYLFDPFLVLNNWKKSKKKNHKII